MKNKTTIAPIFLMALGILLLTSCEKKDGLDTSALDVKINPAFEKAPPIAEDVSIKMIQGDEQHVLLVAKFTKANFKDKFLAIDNDGEKVVLRDDGKDGDEKANDRIFTIKVKQDVKELENTLLERIKSIKSSERMPMEFVGRSAVNVNPKLADHSKFLEGFRSSRLISIKDFLRLPAPVSLRSRSLMITDLGVVEDNTRTWNSCDLTGNVDGPWTFKTLMKNLASTNPGALVNDVQLSDFVENWLQHWATLQTINGESVAAKAAMATIIADWKTRSQTLPVPRIAANKLDMRAAPFKLTAIVNRLDLRGNIGYGVTNAGEARFVFCLMNECTPQEFNIIFEYGVPKKSCSALKAFATQWYNLKNETPGSAAYNSQLEVITDQFSKCGTSPSRPNQSSLNQLRTNEVSLLGTAQPWELREFVIDDATHRFKQTTVKQEPAKKYNAKVNNADVQRLVRYINSNEAAILANTYVIPDQFESVGFLGGKSHTRFRPVGNFASASKDPHHWNGLGSATPTAFITNDDARQNFSLNTCSGCHGGETQAAFTMIDPAEYGREAELAGFLTGTPGRSVGGFAPRDLDGANGIMNVPDPAGRASDNNRRKFSDLQRRADDLQTFVNGRCRGILDLAERLRFRPLNMVH